MSEALAIQPQEEFPEGSFCLIQPAKGWRNRAACKDSDPGIFSVCDTDTPRLKHVGIPTIAEKALNICLSCTVSDECLADAIVKEDNYTIRGGTIASRRYALSRKYRDDGYLTPADLDKAYSEPPVDFRKNILGYFVDAEARKDSYTKRVYRRRALARKQQSQILEI